jgi:hypothetical protein
MACNSLYAKNQFIKSVSIMTSSAFHRSVHTAKKQRTPLSVSLTLVTYHHTYGREQIKIYNILSLCTNKNVQFQLSGFSHIIRQILFCSILSINS